MARSKRQLSDLENLQKENKELRAINKSLSRALKKDSRIYKPSETKEKLMQEDYNEKHTCQECGKGNIRETPLGIRTLISCSVCDFKKTLKKK